MGCGSMLGDLFYLTDALIQRSALPQKTPSIPHQQWVEGDQQKDGMQSLRTQLYKMYGEGQIDEQVFTALRTLSDRGQLRSADLAVHRIHSRSRRTKRGDVEVINALQGVRSRIKRLDDVRSSSASVLNDLDARMFQLKERMDEIEEAARRSIQYDEETTRRQLTEKAELASRYERLSAQVIALRADLKRVDDLIAQLDTKAAELEAVLVRGELAANV